MFTEDRLRMTYGLPSKLEVDRFIDLLAKGKAAPIGEVRTWSGQQYVKHEDGWVHVHPVTGKVSVLPTSGTVRKLDGNDEHKAHFEKYTSPSTNAFKEETPDANALPHSGPVVGQTSSGKNIYRGNQANEYKNFSKQDHLEAGGLHSYLAGREANKVDTKKAHQGLGSGSIPKTSMQEVHLKASNSHSYFAEHGVKNKQPEANEVHELLAKLKIGDSVTLKKEAGDLTSMAALKSQKLKVVGTVQTGLISQPTFLKVQDEAGNTHEINPSHLESYVAPKRSLKSPDGNGNSASGPVIGNTKSGKNIYIGNKADNYKNFTKEDHVNAAGLHAYLAEEASKKTQASLQVPQGGKIPVSNKQQAHLDALKSHQDALKDILKDDSAKQELKQGTAFKVGNVKNPKVGDNFYVYNQRVKIDKITPDGRYEISHVDGKTKLNSYYDRLVVDQEKLQDKYEKITPVDEDTQAKLKSFETEDYQNRKSDYPRSGEPTSINAYQNFLTFNFKNTSESTGKNFAKRFIENKNLNKLSNHQSIESDQDGDYEDDWITVTVAFSNKSNKEE